MYIYEPVFRTTPTPPPPLHGDPPHPVGVGVGWVGVRPNNPNGTHGLLKGELRTPTQLRMGPFSLTGHGHEEISLRTTNPWYGCRMTM